jgi:hypothetical protein
VIVLIINQYGVLPFKHECEAPISINRHGPMALEIAFQGMQVPVGNPMSDGFDAAFKTPN